MSGRRVPPAYRADDDIPGWIRYPARAIALLVVVPIRFVWELLRHTGRLIGAAVAWAGVYLLWLPLRWLWLHLFWLPLRWTWLTLLRPPLSRLVRYLVIIPVVTVIYRPLRRLALALRPVAVAVLSALWHVLHRWFLRPAGRAIAWVWRVLADALAWAWRHSAVPLGRGIAWLWRHTVVPVARAVAAVWAHTVTPVWRRLRDEIWRPAREFLRELGGR
ncbi:hypothetical protein [Catenuloplanes atrovinosus]|uniref:Uncharacterized protein n=1 Tax=Catenuloplanes atrovinosus TaxID=137266 RepID=A0AAE3YJH6_9ACTN|nr:hypothetical protein [Catenuloplanes atrovinosus]MDR7273550.1 hypothetical protein [Catenuloplanes atrovinosus]